MTMSESIHQREEAIRQGIQKIGTQWFPNDEVQWSVRRMTHHGVFSLVEAVPAPDTVGYPRFEFVLHFRRDSAFEVAGCYCWNHERWELLFTSPGVPGDWLGIPP
jgi:hypothetical protein